MKPFSYFLKGTLSIVRLSIHSDQIHIQFIITLLGELFVECLVTDSVISFNSIISIQNISHMNESSYQKPFTKIAISCVFTYQQL